MQHMPWQIFTDLLLRVPPFQGYCQKGAWWPAAPKTMLWSPTFVAAAPNTLHIKLKLMLGTLMLPFCPCWLLEIFLSNSLVLPHLVMSLNSSELTQHFTPHQLFMKPLNSNVLYF